METMPAQDASSAALPACVRRGAIANKPKVHSLEATHTNGA